MRKKKSSRNASTGRHILNGNKVFVCLKHEYNIIVLLIHGHIRNQENLFICKVYFFSSFAIRKAQHWTKLVVGYWLKCCWQIRKLNAKQCHSHNKYLLYPNSLCRSLSSIYCNANNLFNFKFILNFSFSSGCVDCGRIRTTNCRQILWSWFNYWTNVHCTTCIDAFIDSKLATRQQIAQLWYDSRWN